MTYDPDKKAFVIPVQDMERAVGQMLWAMTHIRLAGGLPLDSYKDHDGPMTSYDFAQSGIHDAIKVLGVSLNSDRFHLLDLRKHK